MMEQIIEPVGEMAAKAGAGVTAAAATWTWLATANDLLQLVVTGLAILTGIATLRYVTAKRKLMEKELNEKVEREE